MTSLAISVFLLFGVTFALVNSEYRYYYRSSSLSSMKRQLHNLQEKVSSLQSPVHVHVHGDEEDHSAHSDLPGAHIHMHLSVGGGETRVAPDEWSYASCFLQPNIVRQESDGVSGYVYFRQKPSTQLEMKLDLERFPVPNANYGYHIHEQTSYERGCNTFGPHFNPYGQTHAGPDDDIRHVGDFGNIQADSDGKVEMVMTDRLASLFGPHSIVGRGIVIHRKADDLGRGGNEESLKTGNAGPRIACCVIGWTKDGPW